MKLETSDFTTKLLLIIDVLLFMAPVSLLASPELQWINLSAAFPESSFRLSYQRIYFFTE